MGASLLLAATTSCTTLLHYAMLLCRLADQYYCVTQPYLTSPYYSESLLVAADLYDGLWPKNGGTNVMQKLYPLHAPIRIDAGKLEASNRLYTKHSVTDYSPPAAGANTPLEVSVFSVEGILERSSTAVGTASAVVSDGELLIIAIKDE